MTTSFAELGLNEQILAGVEALGFIEPTPVQAQAIPLVLAGRDLVASAQTGTGKTAAFVLPTLQLIAEGQITAEKEQATAAASPEAADTSVNPNPANSTIPEDAAADPTAEEGRDEAAAGAASVESALTDAPALAAEPRDEVPTGKTTRRRRRRRRGKVVAQEAEGSSAPRTSAPLAEDGRTNSTRMPASDGTSAAPAGRSSRRRRRRGKADVSGTERVQAPKTPTAPLALVVTPTRELAQQIERVTTVVCQHTGQRSVIVMGGARFDRQLRDLQRGCDLLVATPGRLIDLMERRIVDLSRIRVLVLDEADRMLDMGFWPSVRRILQALPAQRQNLLFSATIPPSIKGTVDAMLTDPATVEIARIGQTADTVEEHLMPVTQGQKLELLEALIRTGGAEEGHVPDRVLVFCRTKRRVDDVSKALKAAGLEVDVMHADRRQEAREKALRRFRDGDVQVLVATDVMSRGIDVSGIDAVVNFDVPMDPEDYVHRIGRTGRAGATGHAYTFMAPDEVTPLREIEYFTKKLVPTWDLPGFAYASGRIMPQASRTTTKPTRTMFAGSRQRGRGPSGGRYGRHY